MSAALPGGRPDRAAIIVPALNEERYIADCLLSLLEQARAVQAIVVVVDGGSSDETVEIVRRLAAGRDDLLLLDNPRRLQSAAVNLAARQLPTEISVLIRADAHALYPPDFVATCLRALRENDATSVVVPMRTTGVGGMQRAIAAVQNSRLGNGGSAHRVGGRSGFVEHGHHAVFDRAFFLSIGGYNESFSHNEDAELDVRALRAGGRIWMCREAAITYFPRSRLWPLARQYFRHGRGRARTLRLHHIAPRPRQLAAPVILLLCLAGVLLSAIWPWAAALPLWYSLVCTGWGLAAAVRARDGWLLGMGPAVITVHLAWALGFFRGVAEVPHQAVEVGDPEPVAVL